jgi:GT2 family glycosyltransferase
VLLGGAPYRLIRLGPQGAALVRVWWDGAPVPDRPDARSLARRLLDLGMAHPVPSGGPSADDVTVVVPVRDRAAELSRCLAGLRGLRVTVVDDGSADPGPLARAAAAAGARYLRRDRSGGPGAARNTGLADASTPLVAFVDSDCVPGPGWLGPLLAHFSDPAVAAAAPRIVPHREGLAGGRSGGREPAGGPVRSADPGGPFPEAEPAGGPLRRAEPGGGGWLARYEAASSTLDMGGAESIVRPGTRVPYVPGAALVVRSAAAGQGFAEDMPVGEDVDFVWRLAEAGWHVRYEPRATMPHQHRVGLTRWFARRMEYGTSAAPLELRHPGAVPAVSMSGWSAAAWLSAALGYPAAGAAITCAVTVALGRRLTPFTGGPWPLTARLAARLAGGGTLTAGRLLGSALSRAWWPLALPAAVGFRRLRLPLATLVLAPPLLGWRERRPPMDPASYLAARLLDDVAYSIGVWRGCLAHRTIRPLAPALWWRSRPSEPGGPRPGSRA